MRQAIARAHAAGLGPRQWSTLAAVLSATGTWSKLEDRLYVASIAAAVFGTDDPTRSQLDKIGRDLAALDAHGIIERDPPAKGRPRKSQGGPRYRVALPEMRPAADAFEREECARDEREMRPPLARNAPAHRRPTEKNYEKGAEGAALVDRLAALVTAPTGRLKPGELARLARMLADDFGHAVVDSALSDLEAADARYAWPSELAPALRAAAARIAAKGAEARTRADALALSKTPRGNPTDARRLADAARAALRKRSA
jgi:hypothetical protein